MARAKKPIQSCCLELTFGELPVPVFNLREIRDIIIVVHDKDGRRWEQSVEGHFEVSKASKKIQQASAESGRILGSRSVALRTHDISSLLLNRIDWTENEVLLVAPFRNPAEFVDSLTARPTQRRETRRMPDWVEFERAADAPMYGAEVIEEEIRTISEDAPDIVFTTASSNTTTVS